MIKEKIKKSFLVIISPPILKEWRHHPTLLNVPIYIITKIILLSFNKHSTKYDIRNLIYKGRNLLYNNPLLLQVEIYDEFRRI